MAEQQAKNAKKYTLIDGFDKIDLSRWTSFLGARAELVTLDSNLSYYNQKFLPNPASYKFMPDMFRFLTGRRFYINASDWTLSRPPGAQADHHLLYTSLTAHDTDPTAVGVQKAQHGLDFYIDVSGPGRIADTLNDNFKMIKSEMTFEHYFTADAGGQSTFAGSLGGFANYDGLLASFDARATALSDLLQDGKNNVGIHPVKPVILGSFLGDSTYVEGTHLSSLQFIPLNAEYAQAGESNLIGNFGDALFGWGGAEDAWTSLLPGHPYNPAMPAVLAQLMFLPYTPDAANTLYRHPYHTYFVADCVAGVGTQNNPLLGAHTAVVTINPYYEYYNEFVESFPLNITTELQLPNVYAYTAFKSLPLAQASAFRSLMDLGQDGEFTQESLSLLNYIRSTQGSSEIKKLWKSTVQSPLALPMDSTSFAEAHRYRTIVISDKNLLNATRKLKKAMPYGVEIDLGPQSPSPLMRQLQGEDEEYIQALMSMLANNTTNGERTASRAHRFVAYRGFGETPSSDFSKGKDYMGFGVPGEPNAADKLGLLDLQIFDLSQLVGGTLGIDEFYTLYGKFINDAKNVHISPNQLLSPDVGKTLYYAMVGEMAPLVKQYLEDKAPTMEGIYNGDRCHTEVVAYEIAKFKRIFGDAGDDFDYTGKYRDYHVQSVFIPNMFDSSTPLGYLDTQVFYGGEYVYEIFAHTLIAGSVYKYRSPTDYQLGIPEGHLPGEANLGAPQEKINEYVEYDYNFTKKAFPFPYGIIVRAPYYNNKSLVGPSEMQQNTLMLDKPPLPPDITFHPYKGKEDKVLLLLNQNYGERALIPNTEIFPEDAYLVSLYKSAQKYEQKPQGHILYRTDDNVGHYEIYRLNKKPQFWADFRDAASVKNITLDSTRQSGIDDTVSPNVDYYYFARFVDVHGNISNPTNIFKLRIVKEEATPPYMILKPFKFERPPPLTHIPFKKYLKIALNDDVRHVTGFEAKTAKVAYGPPTGGTFKKYKFRVTSTKTGKKIDINVDLKSTIVDKYLSAVGYPQSEAQKQGEELINDVNIINSSDELCGD
jgi:hypothetical protein